MFRCVSSGVLCALVLELQYSSFPLSVLSRRRELRFSHALMFQVMQGASRCIKACATSKEHKPDEQSFYAATGFQEDFVQSKQSYCLTNVKKQNGLQQTKELNSCQYYELLLQERLIIHDDF
jgi:hypothetical protein